MIDRGSGNSTKSFRRFVEKQDNRTEGSAPRNRQIDDMEVIEKILRHLDLWPETSLPARAPPKPVIQDYVIEPVLNDCQYFHKAAVG